MNRSIVVQGLYPEIADDLDKLLNVISTVGQLNWYQTIEFFHDGSWNDYQKIREKLTENNLSAVFLAGFPMKKQAVDIGALDENERSQAVDFVKHWIDVASYLEADKMLILSGPEIDSNRRERAYAQTEQSLLELCAYVNDQIKRKKPEITLEFFNNSGDPFLLVGPIDKTIQLTKAVHSKFPDFQLTYDISHVVQLKDNPQKSWQLVKPYSRHVHLANCVTSDKQSPFFGDKHPPFNIDQGDLTDKDIRYFVNELKNDQAKFDDLTIGTEIIKPAGMDSDKLMIEATDLFKNALGITD